MIDVGESPIERPKKYKNTTAEKAMQRGLGGFLAEPSAQIVVSDDWDALRPQRLHQERKDLL